MYLVLRVNHTALARRLRPIREIEAAIGKFQDEAAPMAMRIAMETMEDRFLDEGPPDWKELAPSTQRQRKALGYGATGPKLRRTGDLLRSLTDKTDAMNIHLIRQYSKRTVGILGTKDTRYPELQRGNELEGGHVPARWMWPGPGGQEEIAMFQEIEESLLELLTTTLTKIQVAAYG